MCPPKIRGYVAVGSFFRYGIKPLGSAARSRSNGRLIVEFGSQPAKGRMDDRGLRTFVAEGRPFVLAFPLSAGAVAPKARADKGTKP